MSTGNFTVLPSDNKAQIETFKPTAGPVGYKVSIKGKNFIDVTKVKFGVKPNGRGGVEASSFITENPELIIAFVPQVPQGSEIGRIKVKTRNNGAAISKIDFRVTEFGAPEVSSFSSTSGYKDQSVTITGKNFVEVSAVKFGDVATGFTVIDDAKTRIVASVPIFRKPEEGPLVVPISVTNPVDTFVTEDDRFTVTPLPQPKIDEKIPFDPPNTAVGKLVTIRGENFIQISAPPSTVEFFDGKAPQLSAGLIQGNPPDNTLCRAFVPDGAKPGRVKVTTPGGSDISAVEFKVDPPERRSSAKSGPPAARSVPGWKSGETISST
jgi:hypothetical protein